MADSSNYYYATRDFAVSLFAILSDTSHADHTLNAGIFRHKILQNFTGDRCESRLARPVHGGSRYVHPRARHNRCGATVTDIFKETAGR